MTSWHSLGILIFLPVFASACQPLPAQHFCPSFTGDMRDYSIAVDRDGRARDPTDFKHTVYLPSQFQCKVAQIFKAMDNFHAQHSGPRKILIFIHGGLNTPDDALYSASWEVDNLLCAGYFPIFINWESDLFDSYGEHLGCVTQGEKAYDHPALRGIQSPLYFVADAGRAIARIPIVWINQLSTDVTAGVADFQAVSARNDSSGGKDFDRWTHTRSGRNTGAAFAELLQSFESDAKTKEFAAGRPSQIQISIGRDDDTNPWHMAGLFGMYCLTSPTKFGTSWILDGLGKSAWDNMSRRTQTMFEGKAIGNPSSLQANSRKSAPAKNFVQTMPSTRSGLPAFDPQAEFDWDSMGAVDYFKNALAKHIQSMAPEDAWKEYEITLVGHSMGAMVFNEWIRRNYEDSMFYRNIVYMGAACSIRGFENTVIPYLRAHHGTSDHPEAATRFYDLTLHPIAELREKNHFGGDVAVRGSLLTWIDEFLADPATPLDRTLGRWDNIVQCAFVIPQDVRGQITIKAMSLNPDDRTPCQGGTAPDPQIHGGFRNYHYWEESFWTADLPSAPREQQMKLRAIEKR